MKKIVVVFIGNIFLVPPVISLINALSIKGHEVHAITNQVQNMEFEPYFNQGVKIWHITCEYKENDSLLDKYLRMLKIRKHAFQMIDNLYNDETILWIAGDTTIKNLGRRLFNYRYILHVLELSEEIYYHYKLKFLKVPGHILGENAKAVVVPEYNRAHITKAWWNLSQLPIVLPNKPLDSSSGEHNLPVRDKTAKEILGNIGDRKIILYQGILHKERPLDKFIDAVRELGDRYAFVVMSGGEDIYKGSSENYYFIPFIQPPEHLDITSHAYIGVLSYFPTKTRHSILNAVFCAPNKTFEYAKFGIPMLSNDVPALKYIFDTKHCGLCVDEFNVTNIKKAILDIEKAYDTMSRNAKKYYESVNWDRILDDILDSASV